MTDFRRCRSEERRSAVILALFFVFSLGFLLLLADRDGYEGDDLNSILPMLHLDAAKKGELLIYRYGWQPLSYEFGSSVFRVFETPSAIFLLAPIFGAIALVILLAIIWNDRRSMISLAISLIALCAIPEFWFTALYFNSTILGLPFLVGCLALIRPSNTQATTLFAGCLLGIAALMRLDFVLAAPLLALIAYRKTGLASHVLYLALGTCLAFAAAYLAGILDLPSAIEIYKNSARELAEKASSPGWDLRAKLGTLSVMFSPVGWIILLLGAPTLVLGHLRRNLVQTVLFFVASAFLFLPLLNLLSVKYAVPLLVFAALVLSSCLSKIEAWQSHRLRHLPIALFGTATILLALVSVSLSGTAPFIHIGTSSKRTIPTHDGPRSYGGYFWQMAMVDRFAGNSPDQTAANEIADDFLTRSGPDIVILGSENFFDPGAIGWRHLQLRLESEGLHGILIAPHSIRFSRGDRTLTLRLNSAGEDDPAAKIKLYDLRNRHQS